MFSLGITNIYGPTTQSYSYISIFSLPQNACTYILFFFEKGRNAAWFSSMHETDNIYNMLFFELYRICTSDPISVLKEVNVICCCLLLSKIIFMYDLWAIISLTKWIRMHSNIYNTENAEIINLG
jgi:hypothetical protein